jgi:hypothetical protein
MSLLGQTYPHPFKFYIPTGSPVESVESGITLPRFESWLCTPDWETSIILIGKINLTIILSLRGLLRRLNNSVFIKYLGSDW